MGRADEAEKEYRQALAQASEHTGLKIGLANAFHQQGFTDEDLAQTFDAFGLVIGALLARDKTGATKNHGLVDIAPQKAADAAIAAMNGTVIGGSQIEVRRADPAMSITVPGPSPSRARMERREPRPAPRTRAVVVEHRSLRPRF